MQCNSNPNLKREAIPILEIPMETRETVKVEHYPHRGVIYAIEETVENHRKIKNDPEKYILSNEGCLEIVGIAEIANTTTEKKGHVTSMDRAAVKLLIEEYKSRREQFRNPKIPKKQLWQEIVLVFHRNGYTTVTREELDAKMRNLKRTYTSIKSNNSKKTSTGRGRITWEYFQDFEEIYCNDKTINLGGTLSSFGSTKRHEPSKASSSGVSSQMQNSRAQQFALPRHTPSAQTRVGNNVISLSSFKSKPSTGVPMPRCFDECSNDPLSTINDENEYTINLGQQNPSKASSAGVFSHTQKSRAQLALPRHTPSAQTRVGNNVISLSSFKSKPSTGVPMPRCFDECSNDPLSTINDENEYTINLGQQNPSKASSAGVFSHTQKSRAQLALPRHTPSAQTKVGNNVISLSSFKSKPSTGVPMPICFDECSNDPLSTINDENEYTINLGEQKPSKASSAGAFSHTQKSRAQLALPRHTPSVQTQVENKAIPLGLFQSKSPGHRASTGVPIIDQYSSVGSMEITAAEMAGRTTVDKEKFSWKHTTATLLIKEYKTRSKLFQDPKISKKGLWQDILLAFRRKGYLTVTREDLDAKMRNLKKTYMSLKKCNSTDRGRVTWEFFQDFEEIFGGDKDKTINFGGTHEPSETSSPALQNSRIQRSPQQKRFSPSNQATRGRDLAQIRKKQLDIEETRVKEIIRLREAIEESNRIQRERNAILQQIAMNGAK